MGVNINDLKALREKTSAGVSDCREALEQTGGEVNEAIKLIKKWGLEKAAKKADREVKAGGVFSYIHHTGRLGAILSLACETDFVAKTDDFQKLGKEIALHIASMKPATVEELLEQEYVRDGSKKISDLVKETIGKIGENMSVVDFKVLEV